MIDYENMIKALRLSWLKRIMDVECSCFLEALPRLSFEQPRRIIYLSNDRSGRGGPPLSCLNAIRYDVIQLNILLTFYLELLSLWSELRESADPDRGYKYILWNNKEILIEGKTIFYRHITLIMVLFSQRTSCLADKTNTESFSTMKKQGLTNTNFLVWIGLRQSVPLNLRGNIPSSKEVIDIENYKP